jgi:hypothetical protein
MGNIRCHNAQHVSDERTFTLHQADQAVGFLSD